MPGTSSRTLRSMVVILTDRRRRWPRPPPLAAPAAPPSGLKRLKTPSNNSWRGQQLSAPQGSSCRRGARLGRPRSQGPLSAPCCYLLSLSRCHWGGLPSHTTWALRSAFAISFSFFVVSAVIVSVRKQYRDQMRFGALLHPRSARRKRLHGPSLPRLLPCILWGRDLVRLQRCSPPGSPGSAGAGPTRRSL